LTQKSEAAVTVSKIWVVAEATAEGRVIPAALELLTGARALATTVEAVTWGDADAVAAELGAHGATTVWSVGDLAGALPGPAVAGAIAGAVAGGAGPDAILIAHNYDGRDIAARLSVRLDRPVLTNIVGLATDPEGGGLQTEHAIFGGTSVLTARFAGDGPGIYVVRAKTFVAEPAGGSPATVAALAPPDLGATGAARIVQRHLEARSGPKLDEASVVVSGGRGLGEAANYALIERLAELLHGAPGASRAIVDAGWVPYSYQVGQTGQTVKPSVYVAAGISGATQHLVGMKSANIIIAINKDREAPIFSVADLGIVGDVTKVLPRLIEALEQR
jgi:electron transfer flavoprotein alpha subunit